MSHVIIEPLDIKIRRAISKILKRDDEKVIRFDNEVERSFTASHPWLEDSKTNDKCEEGANSTH